MKYKKTTLKNGLRIITVPKPGNMAVTVLVLVDAGSRCETIRKPGYNRGVSHFLEHMCFKGTKKRESAREIANDLDSLGARYNAFTSIEYTGYYAKAQAKDLDKILDIVSDIYLNPVFKEEEIRRERGVVIEEINMYADDPQHQVSELFMKLMYGHKNPVGWSISGSRDDVARLRRKDFIKYRKARYVASSTLVVVAGSFNEEATIKKIKKYFAGISEAKKRKKTRIKEKQTRPALGLKLKDSDQTHIVLGIRAFNALDPRRDVLDVIGAILGGGMSSRLFQTLRGKLGAAYYVYAGPDFYSDHGYLAIHAGIDRHKIKKVIYEIMKELKDLKVNLVGEEELLRAKNTVAGEVILGLETSNKTATFYGIQEIVEGRIITPEQAVKDVMSVTAEDVRKVADSLFKDKNLNLAVLGPIKQEKELRKLLHIG